MNFKWNWISVTVFMLQVLTVFLASFHLTSLEWIYLKVLLIKNEDIIFLNNFQFQIEIDISYGFYVTSVNSFVSIISFNIHRVDLSQSAFYKKLR